LSPCAGGNCTGRGHFCGVAAEAFDRARPDAAASAGSLESIVFATIREEALELFSYHLAYSLAEIVDRRLPQF
jgi:hypothetical protein